MRTPYPVMRNLRILAYDYSTRQKSRYLVEEEEAEMIDNGRYRYPKLVFVRRNE